MLSTHATGGGRTWLETRHPDFFARAWATAPDPVDFDDFVGVDLYDPAVNLFVDPEARPRYHTQVALRPCESARRSALEPDCAGDTAAQEAGRLPITADPRAS
jgi:hypothetical protein